MSDATNPIKTIKQADCVHQWSNEPHCASALRNTYECDCGATWHDEWSCECDDECPECGATVSSSGSIEIAPCSCDYLGRKV